MHEGVKKVHFIGIGGIGMSGIAEVLISYGYSVSGSDLRRSALTERLKSLGAKINYSHKKQNVSEAQIVVYSSAINGKNPEIIEAERRKIPAIQRGEMLSEILRKGFSIAVSGAHGKTTTTAMISEIIRTSKIRPTVIIGGILKGVSKNAILGKGKVFVAEADESDGTFQKVRANIAVITNMDREHMDYYRDFESMEDAYLHFMNGVPFDGLVVACGDDLRIKTLLAGLRKRIVTYGLSKSNDLAAYDVKSSGTVTSFTVKYKDKKLGKINLPLAGEHNVRNSLAACAVGLELGFSFRKVALKLSSFEGIERRMEIKGENEGIIFVDDYAHHPTEIKTTLDAAKDIWNPRRIVAVFQPHRYSRTKELLKEFPGAFDNADLVFVTDIYSAGEKRIKDITASSLVKLMNHRGTKAIYLRNWKSNMIRIRQEVRKGDVILSLGAGDINRFFDVFSEREH